MRHNELVLYQAGGSNWPSLVPKRRCVDLLSPSACNTFITDEEPTAGNQIPIVMEAGW